MEKASIPAAIRLYYSTTDKAYYLQVMPNAEGKRIHTRISEASAKETSEKYHLEIKSTGRSYAANMPVQIDIGYDMRTGLLTDAWAGISTAWCHFPPEVDSIINSVGTPGKRTPFLDKLLAALKKGKTIPVHDSQNVDMKIGELSMASIIAGEQLMANKHVDDFADILNHNYSPATADIWFQYACLKKVIY